MTIEATAKHLFDWARLANRLAVALRDSTPDHPLLHDQDVQAALEMTR